jgi:hypothetical protein
MNEEGQEPEVAGAAETSTPDYSSGLHNRADLQGIASDLQRLASAIADDEGRAQRLIDAVHKEAGASVEEIFKEAGVETRVSIARTDATPAEMVEGSGEVAADSTSTTTETHHYEVAIDLGPIHLSAGFDKETTTSTVTH